MHEEVDFLHPDFTDLERKLFTTAPVQRLGRLSQLSYCSSLDCIDNSTIYTAANYSRLAHSVMALGWLQYWLGLVNCPALKRQVDDYNVAVLRSAALLHDLGHAPYSHALEFETPYDHEKRTKELVSRGSVAGVLENAGLESRDVTDTIGGKGKFARIVNSELDVDKVYVYWDDLISGLGTPFARVGTHYMKTMLDFTEIRDDGIVLKVIEDNDINGDEGVVAACKMLDSRTQLAIYLYGSAVNSKSVTMVRNAAQLAIEKGKIEPKELFGMTDWELEQRLMEGRDTRDYIARMRTGRLPKTAIATCVDAEHSKELRKISADRSRRLQFEQRTGSILDINPLSRPPKGSFPVLELGKIITLDEASARHISGRQVEFIREEHEKYVTNRLVAYAEREPEKVGRKVCSELGVEQPEELVTLPGFGYGFMTGIYACLFNTPREEK